MKMNKSILEKAAVAIAGIIALTVIEVVALTNGIDGTMLIIITGAIAGIAGFKIGKK